MSTEHTSRVRATFAFTLGLALLATGCPGSLENIEDFEAAGPGPLVDPCNGLITNKCALANCHDAESTSIDLTLEGREERTVNKPGVTCDGSYSTSRTRRSCRTGRAANRATARRS